MIITIANEKGGAETPILAHNLAALRAMDGHDVLLVDTNPQKHALSWGLERSTAGIQPVVPARFINGKGLQPELENLLPRYDDIVIDTEGRDSQASRSALIAARVAIIPIQPCFMTPTSQEKLILRINTARQDNPELRVLFVLVCVRKEPSTEYLTAIRSLVARIAWATLADTVLHDQSSIHHAFDKGMAVSEYKPADACSISEIVSLYREIFKGRNMVRSVRPYSEQRVF